MGVIAKYKFNNTLEANLLPEFNSEFTSDLYTVTDEVNGEVTTRTIESDSLPTLMRFGTDTGVTDRQKSLLEVYEIDLSNLTTIGLLFGFCINLSKIERLICNATEPKIKSMYYAFAHTKITEIDISDIKINADDNNPLHSLFYNCAKLHTIVGLEIFDHKKFKGSYVNTFSSCPSLTSLDLSNWDTSNVTSMQNMFLNCSGLTSLNLSNWNTSNVTNMGNMFYGCTNLTTLDVSNFDTNNITSMLGMFNGCTQLTSLDLSNFDTGNVTDMSYMFYGCNNLTSLDVSNFNTSKVTNMADMFNNCKNLTTLDISGFDTSKVTVMGYMFQNCHNLTSLDLSNFNTSKVTNMYGMFNNCNKLTTLDVSNFDTSNVTNIDYMLHLCNNLKYLKCNNVTTLNTINTLLPTKSSTSQGTIICKSDITNLDTTTLQSKYWNILDEPTLIAKYVFDKSIHNNCIPEFNTGFEGYFIEDEVMEGSNEVIRTIESCGMLPTKVRFGNSYVGNDFKRRMSLLKMLSICNGLTSCQDMFAQCSNLISVCDIDTSNVTNMSTMFYKCSKLTTLDVSNFDTSNVTNMHVMFQGCTSLTSLDASNWNTSNVTNMQGMFQGCKSLTSLDLSNFNTSKVTTMQGMFSYCINLTSLDVSNWNTNNVTDTTDMFSNTPLLTDISVLYMDKSSLQKLVDAMPTDSNKTLWYKDVNIDGITHGDNITLKKYMEGNVEIVLNSPLLEGDRIEVKDGKLCHYHKMGMVVLDGSEDEGWVYDSGWKDFRWAKLSINQTSTTGDANWALCDKLVFVNYATYIDTVDGSCILFNIDMCTIKNYNINQDIETFRKWLQVDPLTAVYKLAEPYYEDITNLQSAPTLKTYLECSMEIDTNLPIDTNVTYRTNLSSVYVMERELDELDNGTDLGDILEGEVNE